MGPRSIEVVRARGLVPFLDLAYQGFGDGIDADGAVVRALCADAGAAASSSSSFSKIVLAVRRARRRAVASSAPTPTKPRACCRQLKRVVRTNYSNPPTHGGADRRDGAADAGAARAVGSRARRHARAHQARCARRWSRSCTRAVPDRDFAFMLAQRGMFSYSGLTRRRCMRLRSEYSIYAVDTGRICVAALNSHNVDYVADAIAKVMTVEGQP